MTLYTPDAGIAYPAISDPLADYHSIIGELADQLDSALVGVWQPLTYLTGWGDYDPASIQAVQFKVLPGGETRMRGLAKRISGTTVYIGVLPVGSRPARRRVYEVNTQTGSGRVDIYPDGTCKLAGGGTGHVSFEKIVVEE